MDKCGSDRIESASRAFARTWNSSPLTLCRAAAAATHDELLAATYMHPNCAPMGFEPAGDSGGYLQRATLVRAQAHGAPQITFRVQNMAQVSPGITARIPRFSIWRRKISQRPLRKVDIDKGEPERAGHRLVLSWEVTLRKVRSAASALPMLGLQE